MNNEMAMIAASASCCHKVVGVNVFALIKGPDGAGMVASSILANYALPFSFCHCSQPSAARRCLFMSHPEFLRQKFKKVGVQRALPSDGVRGVPEKLFFPFFSRAAAGGARGEVKWGTAPHPRQRAGCPLQSRLVSGLTYVERRFEKFGMTHDPQKANRLRR